MPALHPAPVPLRVEREHRQGCHMVVRVCVQLGQHAELDPAGRAGARRGTVQGQDVCQGDYSRSSFDPIDSVKNRSELNFRRFVNW